MYMSISSKPSAQDISTTEKWISALHISARCQKGSLPSIHQNLSNTLQIPLMELILLSSSSPGQVMMPLARNRICICNLYLYKPSYTIRPTLEHISGAGEKLLGGRAHLHGKLGRCLRSVHICCNRSTGRQDSPAYGAARLHISRGRGLACAVKALLQSQDASRHKRQVHGHPVKRGQHFLKPRVTIV